MSTKERLAEVVDELQRDVVEAYRRAIRTGDQDDYRKAQAAELLMSRVHGRPTQPTEDVTEERNPVLEAFASLTPEERRSILRLAQPLPAEPEAASAQG